MDTQDAQDNQDETRLRRKRTPSMIRGACEVIPMGLRANSRILIGSLFLLFQTSLFVRSGSQKKAPARFEPGLAKQLAFHQYSNAMLKRTDRIPARNPGSRVAVGELMLKAGWLGGYPQLA